MGEIRYINTDLEIASPVDIAPLVAALEAAGVAPLNDTWRRADGSWGANFETDEQHDHPQPNIEAILAIVEALDATARQIWDGCTLCELNLGYESGDTPRVIDQQLPAELLRRIAAVGASLRITIYAPSV